MALSLVAGICHSQNLGLVKPRIAEVFIASEYGQWRQTAETDVPQAGTATISLGGSAITLPDGDSMQPLRAGHPVLIEDGPHSEIVIPTAVQCLSQSSTCSLTAVFTRTHHGHYGVGSATAGIQEAIDQASAGAEVFVPAGSYTVSPIQMAANVHLRGAGKDITNLTLRPGSNNSIISASQVSQFSISDLTLNGNQTAESRGDGLFIQQSQDFTVHSLSIVNTANHGIFLGDGTTEGRILDCDIQNPHDGSGILAGNTPPGATVSDLLIAGNRVSGSAKADGIFVLGSSAIGVYGSHDIIIDGNAVGGNADTGIEVGQSSKNVVVSHNIVKIAGSGTTGIMVRSAYRVTVEGNGVVGSGDAAQNCFYLWNDAGDNTILQEILVSGNRASSCGTSGFGVSAPAGGSQAILLSANRATGNGTDFWQSPAATEVQRVGNISCRPTSKASPKPGRHSARPTASRLAGCD